MCISAVFHSRRMQGMQLRFLGSNRTIENFLMTYKNRRDTRLESLQFVTACIRDFCGFEILLIRTEKTLIILCG